MKKKKTWRRKIYERSPCAGNLRKKEEKKRKDRKLYSEPQILGLQELQPDVSWAENTETCSKMCLHYSAEPLWERHRAPDSSSRRRRRRRREGLDVREVVVAVVVGRAATKVKRVCDYVGNSHLPLTRAHTHTHTHTLQFLLSTKMPLHHLSLQVNTSEAMSDLKGAVPHFWSSVLRDRIRSEDWSQMVFVRRWIPRSDKHFIISNVVVRHFFPPTRSATSLTCISTRNKRKPARLCPKVTLIH